MNLPQQYGDSLRRNQRNKVKAQLREHLKSLPQHEQEQTGYPLISRVLQHFWDIEHRHLHASLEAISNVIEGTDLSCLSEQDHSELMSDLMYLINEQGLLLNGPIEFMQDGNPLTAVVAAMLSDAICEEQLIYWLQYMDEQMRELVYSRIDSDDTRWDRSIVLWKQLLSDIHLEGAVLALKEFVQTGHPYARALSHSLMIVMKERYQKLSQRGDSEDLTFLREKTTLNPNLYLELILDLLLERSQGEFQLKATSTDQETLTILKQTLQSCQFELHQSQIQCSQAKSSQSEWEQLWQHISSASGSIRLSIDALQSLVSLQQENPFQQLQIPLRGLCALLSQESTHLKTVVNKLPNSFSQNSANQGGLKMYTQTNGMLQKEHIARVLLLLELTVSILTRQYFFKTKEQNRRVRTNDPLPLTVSSSQYICVLFHCTEIMKQLQVSGIMIPETMRQLYIAVEQLTNQILTCNSLQLKSNHPKNYN